METCPYDRKCILGCTLLMREMLFFKRAAMKPFSAAHRLQNWNAEVSRTLSRCVSLRRNQWRWYTLSKVICFHERNAVLIMRSFDRFIMRTIITMRLRCCVIQAYQAPNCTCVQWDVQTIRDVFPSCHGICKEQSELMTWVQFQVTLPLKNRCSLTYVVSR